MINKTAEKKLSKQISHGYLFEKDMLLTSDEICGKFKVYSYNTNLRVHPKPDFFSNKSFRTAFVTRNPIDNLKALLPSEGLRLRLRNSI